MIIDYLCNIDRYNNSNFSNAIRVIQNNVMPQGKSFLNNIEGFILCFTYNTTHETSCIIESHEKYIDIHVVLEGEEIIGLFNPDLLEKQEIDYLNDCITYKHQNCSRKFLLEKGYFAIFYPNEAHITGISSSPTPTYVKKIVVKIPMLDKNVEYA